MEHIENERVLYGKVNRSAKHSAVIRHLPSQTDESGSAIRIRNQRPQTPRINLLKLSRQQFSKHEPSDQHPLFSHQAQLIKSKPNFLNPLAKLGVKQPNPVADSINQEAESLLQSSNAETSTRKRSPKA